MYLICITFYLCYWENLILNIELVNVTSEILYIKVHSNNIHKSHCFNSYKCLYKYCIACCANSFV